MQVSLPSRLDFQTRPGDISPSRALADRLYNVATERAPFYRSTRGIGFTPTLCDPRDIACVQANVAASIENVVATGEAQAASLYDQCIANGTGEDVCSARWPVGYSGYVPATNLTPIQQQLQMETPVQAASSYLDIPVVSSIINVPKSTILPGYVPGQLSSPPVKPNQSVPPSSVLTPMPTGFKSTAASIAANGTSQQPAGSAPTPDSSGGTDNTTTGNTIFGMDQKTVLIVAGIGAVLLFMGGKR